MCLGSDLRYTLTHQPKPANATERTSRVFAPSDIRLGHVQARGPTFIEDFRWSACQLGAAGCQVLLVFLHYHRLSSQTISFARTPTGRTDTFYR